jgi:MFS family permease
MQGRRTGSRGGRGRADGGAFDRKLIAPMIIGSILNPINTSMLAVALIPIGQAFGAPPSETAWLVSGLYLSAAVAQPVIGRMVDSHGPRMLYLMGTALVGVAGLVGVFSPDLWVLVLSRVLLGIGTSAAYPASMFLLRSESARTGVKSPSGILSALSVANQVMAVVGPTLGGLLIGLGSWRWLFGVNVPLAAICLVLGARRLPRWAAVRAVLAGERGTGPVARAVDVPGMALFAGTMTAFMFFLMNLDLAHGWLAALAVLLGGGFVWRELRCAEPFIDLRVLRGNGPLLATFLRQVLAYVTTYSFLYGFSQWLEEGRGMSPSTAGLILLPLSGAAVVATAVTGRYAEVRGKLLVGATLQIAACGLLLTLDGGTPVWLLAVVALVMGVPQGLIGLANQNALYAQAEPARMGSSAGLLRTFTYLGALLSASATGAKFRDGATSAGLHGLSGLLLVVAVLFLVVAVADRSLGRVGRETAQADRA